MLLSIIYELTVHLTNHTTPQFVILTDILFSMKQLNPKIGLRYPTYIYLYQKQYYDNIRFGEEMRCYSQSEISLNQVHKQQHLESDGCVWIISPPRPFQFVCKHIRRTIQLSIDLSGIVYGK